LPTIAEAGVPGYEMTGWYALITTANVPEGILARLNSEVQRGLQRKEIREMLATQGAEAVFMSLPEVQAFVRSEVAKWAKVVTDLNVRVE
jgi:tripartite-type tricarboxylate transporter receptor subunit TctC